MALIDLIVLVLVVVIVVTRFTKFKLPTDKRDAQARRSDLDRLRQRPLMRDDLPEQQPVDMTPAAQATKPARKPSQKEMMAQAKNLTGMAKLKALDPGFKEPDFLEGAKAAYGYFYESWNARDEEGLDNLCAPALFGRLMNDMNDDATFMPVVVDEIVDARIGDVKVHGQTAIVSVDFEAEQREGDGPVKVVHSRWVLARPLGSEDPNWELQDIVTRSDA